MRTVMVTGVGAIIGYGVLRSLRRSGTEVRLVGVDASPTAVGAAWCDQFIQAPFTSAENYADWLDKAIAWSGTELLIPCIEQDVAYLAAHADEVSKKTRLALNRPDLIRIATDKGLMDEELQRIGSPARIETRFEGSFASLAQSFGVPFLVKPRRSYASKGLVKISSPDEFRPFESRLGTELMVQPIIGDDDAEYTVGVFGDGLGNVLATITLRRLLAKDGSTAAAWQETDATLDLVVAGLCAHFAPLGPTNLQFRKSSTGWKLLEINPRISSSTSIRAALGFNDALMCLDYYLEGKPIVQPVLKPGHIKRYIEDLIVNDRTDL